MATIRREIRIKADPEQVWAAVRDVGAIHERLTPGMVTDTKMDGDTRLVTFAHGPVARELIVSLDDVSRRFAYSVIESSLPMTHHHAVFEVDPDGPGCTLLIWTADVFPHEVAGAVRELMTKGGEDIKRTLEAG